ncbi:MAG: hypothetical protein M1132_04725 [Chloroflexi bacterium]|nr:hypothetical protein [Chloroflexota bacterium]
MANDGMDENSAVSSLKVLELRDVVAIDQALDKIGPYGEVHLVVEKGRLRFIRTVRSEAVTRPVRPEAKAV